MDLEGYTGGYRSSEKNKLMRSFVGILSNVKFSH